jgi:hypothetical protein
VQINKAEPQFTPGAMKEHASKVLMKILYGARMARMDLLRVVNQLACLVTKWDEQCDKKLHRLVCYIKSTLHWRQIGWVGDPLSAVSLHLFADADFAGVLSKHSTSGVFLCLRGENTSFPLQALSKRQSCVSHSTQEAEIVAANTAVRAIGIPAMPLWDVLLSQKVRLTFHEDNQAAIYVCKNGRNPTSRTLGRTHGVCVAWLHENFANGHFDLIYEKTDAQAADIFTKGFTDIHKWEHACKNINHVVPKEWWSRAPAPRGIRRNRKRSSLRLIKWRRTPRRRSLPRKRMTSALLLQFPRDMT